MKSKKVTKIRKDKICKHIGGKVEIYGGRVDDDILTEYAVCKQCKLRFTLKWKFMGGTKYWGTVLPPCEVLEHGRIVEW